MIHFINIQNMQYQTLGTTHILRFNHRDDIISILQEFAETHDIRAAAIQGIGAFASCTLRFYDLKKKTYFDRDFTDDHEVTSLSGNISLLDGKPFIHAHATISDREFRAFGGHVKSATAGATLEVIIMPLDGTLTRAFDKDIGLNLLEF